MNVCLEQVQLTRIRFYLFGHIILMEWFQLLSDKDILSIFIIKCHSSVYSQIKIIC